MPLPALLVTYWVPGAIVVAGTACGALMSRRSPSESSGSPETPSWEPELEEAYQKAMHARVDLDPEALKALCARLRKAGHTCEAEQVLCRNKLRNLAPDLQEQRREAVRQAFNSTDPMKVGQFADALEQEGLTNTANALRGYAAGL